MQMLTFFLVSGFFILAGKAALRILTIMISEGQMLDKFFGWQKMLARLYQHPVMWKDMMGKALGNCEICMSFWFQPLWFALYWGFCRLALHYFITDEGTAWYLSVIIGVIWYIAFHAIGAIGGMFSIIRAKMKIRNGLRMQ